MDGTGIPEDAPLPEGEGIRVPRASTTSRDWNAIHYETGLCRNNVGSTRLSMKVATILPGGVAAAHLARSDADEWHDIVPYPPRGEHGRA